MFQLLLSLILALNIFTFALFGYDKWIAGGRARRIPEKVLWTLCLLGGSAGGIAGMYTFRHKTRKTSFQFVLAGIFLLQMVAAGTIAYFIFR